MINKLFPFKFYLRILQLEDYDTKRLFKWAISNFFSRKPDRGHQVVWTRKSKQIYWTAVLFSLTLIAILTIQHGITGVVVGILLSTQSYLFIILGSYAREPYEKINKKIMISKRAKKITSLKKGGLIVIGITGSYGKTSTKIILEQILKSKYEKPNPVTPTSKRVKSPGLFEAKVLSTPKSYNNLFSIQKVVDLELDESYDFFICEMGAYRPGQIKDLCTAFVPTHVILTGINEQHLVRFKTLENTVKSKFEIVRYANPQKVILLNKDSDLIMQNYKKYINKPTFYGESANNAVKISKLGPSGTEFDLVLNNKTYKAKTNLLGRIHIQNILAASVMAHKVGVPSTKIINTIKNLKPIPHRLELKNLKNGNLLLDNAYSSNIKGFNEAIELLSTFAGRTKIIATPGIVELGDKTEKIHNELGKLIDGSCDYAVLVGKNDRTLSLAKTISRDKIIYIDNMGKLHDTLNTLNLQAYVVLIENDVTDNY